VGFEKDVRAGRAELNKEPISRADDYGELAEEKYDEVVGLAEDCEEAAVASVEAATLAIETSQRQVVQLPPIGGGGGAGSAAAAAKPKPRPKPKPPVKASAVRVLQPLQASPTGMTAALAATHLQSATNLPKRPVPHGSSNQEGSAEEDLTPRPSTTGRGKRQKKTPRSTDFIYDHATRAEEQDKATPAGFGAMAADSDDDDFGF
jgi:hypothetical protein